jgi:hypothetical protein
MTQVSFENEEDEKESKLLAGDSLVRENLEDLANARAFTIKAVEKTSIVIEDLEILQ